MRRPYPVTVGVDGSVFRFHPHVKRLMHNKIGELVDKGIEVSQ
ncbi:unnamed protein product [Cylicostephanus goldi]|uniref:Phosphotransferase n=1 Tax=Cylicostephanus goldi TaxID=71465 RepID=A0A3P6S9P3_CYLGO|nr:unnamed protein product [Cylicostephanus goldi]